MGVRTASGLAIHVLGPLEAMVDGQPLVADTRKALAILGLLAVDGRPFARDELVAMFWPDSDDEAARGSLRRTLSTLRSALGDRWIEIDRTRVVLARQGVWLDLREVDAALSAGDRQSLESAASLVRGPFLAGFNLRDSPAFDDWRAARSSSVERTVANLLDGLAELQAGRGDLLRAVATARRRLELDPLDEPAQRRIIGLLADSGDRAGAIRQYRNCAAVLHRELGVVPLAETIALYEAIRDGTYAPPQRVGAPSTAAEAEVHADPGRGGPSSGLADDSAQGPAARSLPFVGREAELGAIRRQHAAVATDGRVVVVEGEPGIGKTRLMQEAADELGTGGAQVLMARAWAAESGIAYAPIVDLLRGSFGHAAVLDRLAALPDGVRSEVSRLIALPASLQPAEPPSRAEALDPALARARLIDALASTLTTILAGPQPGVLAFDDLHLADASTLQLVGWLLRRLAGRPILLVVAWRPEDLDDQALPIAGFAEGHRAAVVLRLRRLDRPAVAQLVAGLGDTDGDPWDGSATALDGLLEASEGLPLDLAERLAGRAEGAARLEVHDGGGPQGFRALLRDRLARVGETAGQVLAAGAVIGRSFDLATVRAASGRAEEETVLALEELIRRGLIRESARGPDLRFDFAHASLRDAALDGLSHVRRRLLHRRVAEALRAGLDRTASAGDLARLVLIAQHERDGGQSAEAAASFRVAAEAARRVYANREAIEMVESAIALGGPGFPGLQRQLGELRLGLGQYVLAIAAFETAAADARGLELLELELLLARAHARRGDLVTAASHLDAALPQGEGGEPDISDPDGERRLQ
ncbi:MAG TPA: AAA family ATPase, partial [Gemmatimonadales bacterium]|nr:AAA family ATPase [Gemmatimonadales bacterium]